MGQPDPPPAYDKIYEVEPSSIEPLNPPRYPAFLHSQRSSTGIRQPDRAPLILSESQAQTPIAPDCKTPLQYEMLAKSYIVFFAAICWIAVFVGLILGVTYRIVFLAFLGCGLVPFPFLIYGYRGIEERQHKLITPLIVFFILLFILVVVPFSVGFLYYSLSLPRHRELQEKLLMIIASIFVVFALIPGPTHAIGTLIFVRHQIVHSGS